MPVPRPVTLPLLVTVTEPASPSFLACEIAAITISNPALVMLPALLTDTAAALPTPFTMDCALI